MSNPDESWYECEQELAAVKLENVTLKQRIRDAHNLLTDAVGGLSIEELTARFHIWLGIGETMEQLCGDDEPTMPIDPYDLCGVTDMHTGGACRPAGDEGEPCPVETRDDLNDSDEFEVKP
jgi:hypothetical protein